MQTNPYLTFDGRCKEAFAFYEEKLGAKVGAIMTYEGTPMADHVPPDWRGKVLHGQITLGEYSIMGSDAPPERYAKPQGFALSLGLTDAGEAERLFDALAEGGIVQMPLQQTFWAVRFGMLVDRFGVPWMINCE